MIHIQAAGITLLLFLLTTLTIGCAFGQPGYGGGTTSNPTQGYPESGASGYGYPPGNTGHSPYETQTNPAPFGGGTYSGQGNYGTNYGGGYPSAYGNYQQPSPRQSMPSSQGQAVNSGRVVEWFGQYDQIRRQAQMTPTERQQADYLLSRGMAILVPGEEKVAARSLLMKLVDRYQKAKQTIRQLPLIPETQQLHRGYYQYFNNAHLLFADYLKVQDNLFITDASTGQPIAGQLIARKQALEQLNQQVQGFDQKLRNQFGIQPYRYQ